jgi:hypothetical protein
MEASMKIGCIMVADLVDVLESNEVQDSQDLSLAMVHVVETVMFGDYEITEALIQAFGDFFSHTPWPDQEQPEPDARLPVAPRRRRGQGEDCDED